MRSKRKHHIREVQLAQHKDVLIKDYNSSEGKIIIDQLTILCMMTKHVSSTSQQLVYAETETSDGKLFTTGMYMRYFRI